MCDFPTNTHVSGLSSCCSVLFSGSPESQYKTYERYEFDGMVEAFGRLAF